ncbi:MAG: hypothetical protein HC945_03950 [Nitrosarchaeum sp.]|nr:hypothetical protein [Nitrosarchaeum sp.]
MNRTDDEKERERRLKRVPFQDSFIKSSLGRIIDACMELEEVQRRGGVVRDDEVVERLDDLFPRDVVHAVNGSVCSERILQERVLREYGETLLGAAIGHLSGVHRTPYAAGAQMRVAVRGYCRSCRFLGDEVLLEAPGDVDVRLGGVPYVDHTYFEQNVRMNDEHP